MSPVTLPSSDSPQARKREGSAARHEDAAERWTRCRHGRGIDLALNGLAPGGI
jgi:hypothetical protein